MCLPYLSKARAAMEQMQASAHRVQSTLESGFSRSRLPLLVYCICFCLLVIFYLFLSFWLFFICFCIFLNSCMVFVFLFLMGVAMSVTGPRDSPVR